MPYVEAKTVIEGDTGTDMVGAHEQCDQQQRSECQPGQCGFA